MTILSPVHEPRTLKAGPLADHPFRDSACAPEASQGPRRRFLRRRRPAAALPRAVPLPLALRLYLGRDTLIGLAMVAIGVLGIVALHWLSPLILLLPGAGLAETTVGIHRGALLSRLLAVGLTTRARVVELRADGGKRYATIEFHVDGVTIRAEHRLRSPEALDGRATTTVFYSAADPHTHCIAADLPGRPRLDATGALQRDPRF